MLKKPYTRYDNQLEEMRAGDEFDPSLIPLSAKAQNRIQRRADGLYTGTLLDRPTVYISTANGTDVAAAGTWGFPYKTVDYALSQAQLLGVPGYKLTAALRAGETYPVSSRTPLFGDVVFTFYDDPKYGSFDSPLVGGQTDPAVMEDLQRPILRAAATQEQSLWGSTGFNLHGTRLRFHGVRADLAPVPNTPPAPGSYGVPDMVTGNGRLELYGAVVNAVSAQAFSGLIGILPDQEVTLAQFASQFWVAGAIVDGSALATVLAARQYLIKFYADAPGNNTSLFRVFADAMTSSPGSGFLKLTWSDTQSMTVPGSQNARNLGSYPQLSDVGLGFRNYVYGLRRDQQSRPLNVISSRLF